jgi:hypothetical protein
LGEGDSFSGAPIVLQAVDKNTAITGLQASGAFHLRTERKF